MTKHRTEAEAAAGKLISAIQKEWGEELSDPVEVESEDAMSKGHDLLKAAKERQIQELLNGGTIADYVGQSWVERHRSVIPAIEALEEAISRESV